MSLPHRRRRMQSNDQGIGCLRMSSRGRRRLRADPCSHACRRAACSRGSRPRAEGMEFTVAPTTAVTAKPPRGVEQPVAGSAAVARERQRALALDVAAAALQCATALFAMAGHAARAAAAAPSALAAVQVLTARAPAAGPRVLQPLPADAAGKTQPIAPAMAANDPGTAASRGSIAARRTPAAPRAALARSRLVAALRVGAHILGIKQHIAKAPLAEHQRLIGEMRG
jgi:hypothetical protein